jgi:hypothetical protein
MVDARMWAGNLSNVDSCVLNRQVHHNAAWDGNEDSNFVLGWRWDDFITGEMLVSSHQ